METIIGEKRLGHINQYISKYYVYCVKKDICDRVLHSHAIFHVSRYFILKTNVYVCACVYKRDLSKFT